MQSHPCASLVSVIVPVYKAEPYIRKCVSSIAAQTYPHIEILLVDDGSPDASGRICDELAARDGRIRVIHKKNGGSSSARNLGMDSAKGQWVTFVDSDDTIHSDYIASLLSGVNGADMVMAGLNVIFKSSARSLKMPDKRYSRTELMNDFDTEYSKGAFCGPYCKLFLKSILDAHHLRFDESISMCEDLLFVLSYLEHCAAIASIGYCGYDYIKTNPNSIMSVFNIKYYDMRIIAFKRLIDSAVAWKCSDDTLKRMDNIYTFSLFDIIRQGFNKRTRATRRQKRGMVKSFLNDPIVRRSMTVNEDPYLLYKMLRLFAAHKTVNLMYGFMSLRYARRD